MEKKVDVEPYGVIKICDKCKIGEMLPNGNDSLRHGMNIGHECDSCGNFEYLSERYPKINFKVIR